MKRLSHLVRQPKAICNVIQVSFLAHFLPLIIRIIHPPKSYEFEELMCIIYRCRFFLPFLSSSCTDEHFNERILKYH